MKPLILLVCSISILFSQYRPNIIVIMTDDHAKHAVSIYGSRINSTPHIDRIGNEGATFTNAFVTNSICGPSRAVHLTGKYSHVNGIRDHSGTFDGSQWTYPKALQEAGYYTALIGKWHLGSIPTGFDYFSALVDQGEYYNPRFILPTGDTIRSTGYTTEIINTLAMRVIDSIRNKPFCILVHQKAPHRNWMPEPKHFSLFDTVDVPMPENFFDDYAGRSRAAKEQDLEVRNMYLTYDLKLFLEEGEAETGSGGSPSFKLQAEAAWKRDIQRMTNEQREAWISYYKPISDAFYKDPPTGKNLDRWKYQRYIKDYLRCIASVDDNIGILLDHLAAKGILDSTVIIYTSDQGFFLGEHGWYDKRFMYEESIGIPMLIRYPSLFPPGTTKNELVLNLDVAPTLLEIAGITNPPNDLQGKSVLQLFAPGKEWDWRTSMYYHYFEYPRGWHRVKRHYGIRTERYKLIHFYNDTDEWELYDLRTDPHEMNNLANELTSASTMEQLKKELKRLRTLYNDSEGE
uniref:Sulfatase n=1 Tax=uncultured bacterium pAM1 TaxID=1781153 RepID=A0A1C9U4W5_9BACT|nr:sulfatase [uncultured bacterium pAM1]